MRILVPTAGEEAAIEVADYVLDVAKRLNAELTVVHILRDDETQADGERCCGVFQSAGARVGVEVSSHLETGRVVDAIVTIAAKSEADLILMGASRGKLVEHWLSANVMGQCDVPVLVIPHCYRQ